MSDYETGPEHNSVSWTAGGKRRLDSSADGTTPLDFENRFGAEVGALSMCDLSSHSQHPGWKCRCLGNRGTAADEAGDNPTRCRGR